MTTSLHAYSIILKMVRLVNLSEMPSRYEYAAEGVMKVQRGVSRLWTAGWRLVDRVLPRPSWSTKTPIIQ